MSSSGLTLGPFSLDLLSCHCSRNRDTTYGSELKEHPHRPRWTPDEQAISCMKCRTPFSQLNRKHHCRLCGQVFCNKCSDFKHSIPKYDYDAPVRVCQPCYQKCAAAAAVESALMKGSQAKLRSAIQMEGCILDFALHHDVPMTIAARRGDVDAIRLLVNAGADVNYSADGADANAGVGIDTPLLAAVDSGSIDAARILLSSGASVDARRGMDGSTALHVAVTNGDVALTRLLSAHGASVHSKNTRGVTPVDIGQHLQSGDISSALGAPLAPRPPRMFSKSGDSVTIEWAPPDTNANMEYKYEVQSRADGGEWKLVAQNIVAKTMKVRRLQPGRRYTFRVRASIDGQCWSAWSESSNEFGIPADFQSDSWNPLSSIWNSFPNA